MIINVRGTSGSGKTYTIRRVMDLALVNGYARRSLHSPLDGKIKGYAFEREGKRSLYFMGSYETVCGGADTIKTQDEICQLVHHYASSCDIVFEGLLMSHLFARYLKLNRELQHIPYIWAFLDTPLEVCLERVNQRRLERGVTKPLNPSNTTSKWHDMRTVFGKCQAEGLDVRWLLYLTAGDEVWTWLNK